MFLDAIASLDLGYESQSVSQSESLASRIHSKLQNMVQCIINIGILKSH